MKQFVPVRGKKEDRLIITDIVYLDDLTGDSMCKKYNYAIDNLMPDDEWVCFRHDDLDFITPINDIEWFLNNRVPEDVWVAGVIGTYNVEVSLHWWVPFREVNGVGHINQLVLENGKPKTPKQTYPMNDWPGYHEGVASIDGCCMFIRTSAFKAGLRFDEALPDYHFYDVDICLETIARGHGVATVPIDTVHKSAGGLPPNINDLRQNVFKKWNERVKGIWPINKYSKFY